MKEPVERHANRMPPSQVSPDTTDTEETMKQFWEETLEFISAWQQNKELK